MTKQINTVSLHCLTDTAVPLSPYDGTEMSEKSTCHGKDDCKTSHEVHTESHDLSDSRQAEQVAKYHIPAMCCPMEETLIRNKLAEIPGITGLELQLMGRTATIRHQLYKTAPIEEALSSIGMTATRLEVNDRHVQKDNPIPWLRLAGAGVLAALAEIFELVHKWQLSPFGLDLNSTTYKGLALAEYLAMTMALIAIFLGGFTTFRMGWLAIKNRDLNINALMVLAVTGAFCIGQFPEAAMVMVLFNVAEAMESKALDRVRRAIDNLLALSPATATVLQENNTWQEREIKHISIGARVRVRPGERIALDGTVQLGSSTVNQAPITGESIPVTKKIGDPVYAGTINEAGSFEFNVTATADNSTLARIIDAVEKAQEKKAPVQRLVDRLARYYTPAVLVMAILVAVIPPLFMQASWTASLYTALVLLVISCPCALVISTPVVIVSAMAAAAQKGILIKGGIFLEQGRLLKRLAFDKTGTLTMGKPQQTDYVHFSKLDATFVATVAASLAARSDHPVSNAIATEAAKKGLILFHVDAFLALPGQGICGTIKGKQWFLGNGNLLNERQQGSPDIEKLLSSYEKQGKSVVVLLDETGPQAIFAVTDTIKKSSIAAIQELKELGIDSVMLTGDNIFTAQAVAEQAQIKTFHAGLLPAEKLRFVEEMAKEGKVGMVGDGATDAPALAKADISFAMGAAGTDTAIETADVALMDDDLRKIPRFIRLCQRTHTLLLQNISLALSIKALFFALALTGHATMWMAVFADVGTSLLVVANGLRIMRGI